MIYDESPNIRTNGEAFGAVESIFISVPPKNGRQYLLADWLVARLSSHEQGGTTETEEKRAWENLSLLMKLYPIISHFVLRYFCSVGFTRIKLSCRGIIAAFINHKPTPVKSRSPRRPRRSTSFYIGIGPLEIEGFFFSLWPPQL